MLFFFRGVSTFDTPLFLYYSAGVFKIKEKVIHTTLNTIHKTHSTTQKESHFLYYASCYVLRDSFPNAKLHRT